MTTSSGRGAVAAVGARAEPSSPGTAPDPSLVPVGRRVTLALALETGAALVLGLLFLGRHSLWVDEAYTWSTVDRSFGALLHLLVTSEGLQIAHSLLLWPIARVSQSEVALRLPSALAFAATVPAVWLVGRRLFDDRAGLVAGLLFAVNGWGLQYAQEARSYALETALVACAAAALVVEVERPSRRSRVVWVVWSALALYAHGLAVVMIGAQLLALLVLPRERRPLRRWAANVGWLALVAAPAWILPALEVNTGRDYSWVAAPGIAAIRSLAWLASGRTITATVPYALAGAVAGVLLVVVWRRHGRSVALFRPALATSWAVVPAAALMLVSQVRPLYVERYVVASLPAVVVLVAWAVTRIGRRTVLAAAMVVLLVGASRGVWRTYTAPSWQDWRLVTADVLARARPGDGVIFAIDDARLPFAYYARGRPLLRELVPVSPSQPWGEFGTGDQQGTMPADAVFTSLPADMDRVWVVANGDDPAVLLPRIDEARRHYELTSFRRYRRQIDVYLLTRR